MKIQFFQNEAALSMLSQALFVLACFPGIVILVTIKAGLSFLFGGLIAFLPNLYAFRKTFCFTGATAARRIKNAFFQGQAVKWLLTALGFGFASMQGGLLGAWLFIGFIMAQIGFIVLPLFLAIWNERVT